MKKNILKALSLALILAFLLVACTKETPAPTPVISSNNTPIPVVTEPVGDVTSQVPTNPIQEQSPVAPAQSQAQLLLWAPDYADPSMAQAYGAQLQAYASQNALSFEAFEELKPGQLGEQTQLVVALADPADVQAMAEAHVHVQFLLVGNLQESSLTNLHVLSQTQALPEHISFLAGLAAVLSTPEYRVGSITQINSPAGTLARDGFLTGARYYCGLCRSRYTPLVVYPIQAEIETAENWKGALDSLLAQSVKTIFVQAELSSPELINALNTHGITLVALEGQNGIEAAQGLLGVLSTGGMTDILPIVERLLAGEAFGDIKMGIELTRIDESKLGAGRQILFNRFKEDLLNGEINPLPVQK